MRPGQRPERAERLLVCEAEGDALAAVSAIEASGDGGGARRLLEDAVGAVVSTASTSLPVERLVSEVQRVGAREVALAYDADDAGRRAADRARAALEYVGVRAFSLALPEGTDLADLLARVAPEDRAEKLADALLESEESQRLDALEALERRETPDDAGVVVAGAEGYPGRSEKHAAGQHRAEPAKPDRYAGRRYHLAKLVAEADLEPPWRVEPIAADGHLTLLSAAGGEGKTWGGLAFAGGVAHAPRWRASDVSRAGR